jgi:nitronate monooxygenase
LAGGVHGLIAVNDRAGGHAGPRSAQALFDELADLGVPVVCAGGIGDEAGFVSALRMGYAGAQLGTRFIATVECAAHDDYKEAIVRANESDIVLTERVTGVPLAVIRTAYVERIGTKAIRLRAGCCGTEDHTDAHAVRAAPAWHEAGVAERRRRREDVEGSWQAGKSVAGFTGSVGREIVRFAAAAR